MSRPVNPRRFVTFLRDHEVVNPETVLESINRQGVKYVIATIPESRAQYRAGQVLQLSSVNAARDFVKAMNGAAVVGKEIPAPESLKRLFRF